MSSTTQAQLARRLGLSRSTVAAVLNPNSTVKLRDATRKMVEREAAKTGYRPNHNARLMRGVKSGIIGIFHFGGLSQVAAERVRHASRSISAAGYRILACDLSWSPDGAKAACEAMLDAQVEGVIVAGLNDPASATEFQKLKKRGLPMVTLSGSELDGVPHIRGDANRAIRQMTHHLIKRGRRRLLFLAHYPGEMHQGSCLLAYAERLKGFKSALKSSSGTFVEAFHPHPKIQGRVARSTSDTQTFDPYRIAKEILQEVLQDAPLPDAIICGNDDWAIGAMSAIRAAGLSIPKDIAVTGYGNTPQGEYLDVPLTTIAQPSQAMSERAVDILFEIIQKKKARIPPLSQFPCALVIRNSCGS